MRTFLVVGSSRSGTSLTAGLLHKNGVKMGELFTPPSFQNPQGFYEDLHFVNYNVQWLQRAGGNFANPPPQEAIAEQAEKLGADIYLKGIVRGKSYAEWGLKDPRVIWLWPWYYDAFSDRNPHLIVTRRNLSNIAQSLWNVRWVDSLQNGLDTAAMIDKRLDEIINQVNWPTLELHFEQWRENRQRQEERLEAFIGREMNFSHIVDKNL